MNQQIFLENLREALYGKIGGSELAEHMRYYENYIRQETAGGRSEQEVLEELGDPRLIARTILETSGTRTLHREYTVSEDGEADGQPEYGVHFLEGFKAKLVAIGFLAMVILLLVFVFHLVIALLPALLLIGVIGWIIRNSRK